MITGVLGYWAGMEITENSMQDRILIFL
uniref:Uncharacterized protein n=1 Tax=Rhizophora mucronata TaxID=61149 RepID=A0A2P2QH67_RHIMU